MIIVIKLFPDLVSEPIFKESAEKGATSLCCLLPFWWVFLDWIHHYGAIFSYPD